MNGSPDIRVQGVLETCLYARNLDETARFYEVAIGLQPFSEETGRHVFFRCGPAVFLLFHPGVTAAGGMVPGHGADGPGHVAFAVDAGHLAEWRDRLAAAGVPIESEVEWPSGERSLYLRDPAGNSVELASPRIWPLERG